MRPPLLHVALLFAGACNPPGVAVTVERLQAPDEVALEDVVSGVATQQAFEIDNLGTKTTRVMLSVEDPFFLPSPDVTVPAAGSVTVRVGIEAPGYETLVSHLEIRGPNDAISVPLRATFDLDADDDLFIANAAGGSDCNDRTAAVSPAALEVCDEIDNDCNGFIDDDAVDIGTWYRDADGDTWGDATDVRVECEQPGGYVSRKGDCDDSDPDIRPTAAETWYDGIDENCDGRSDYDRDGDGFDHWFYGGTDCRDTNASVHPGAVEIYYDGVDQNCDGASDYDADGDGADAEEFGGTDCDDTSATRFPGATELDDGVDQDCDGLIDEDFVLYGDVLFTEILVTPATRDPADGQYAEIYNATVDRTIPLDNYTIASDAASGPLPAFDLAPGETALLCANLDSAQNGGLTCDGALPAVLDVDDHLSLTGANLLDEVDWTGWTLTTGASLELGVLDPDDNDLEGSWCAATASWDGDLGTPGTVTASCVLASN